MRLTARKTKRYDVPNDPDEGFIVIRHLSKGEVRKVESKVNQLYYQTNGSGEGDTRIDFDPYTRSRLFAREAITKWGSMYDLKGRDMKLTAANLDKASVFTMLVNGEKVDFYEWVDDCRKDLDEEVEAETKEAEEN